MIALYVFTILFFIAVTVGSLAAFFMLGHQLDVQRSVPVKKDSPKA